MIIEGQGHFFIINFPGFVCFVLYLAKISGERLQDHWSSGFSCLNYWSYAPFKGSECNFVSKIFRKSLKLGASNLFS